METVYIKLLCVIGDRVSQVVMCKWRRCISSCYVQVQCTSRCAHQLTLVPYPYLRYNQENSQTKSTIKHLVTAVCPSVWTAGFDITKCVRDRQTDRSVYTVALQTSAQWHEGVAVKSISSVDGSEGWGWSCGLLNTTVSFGILHVHYWVFSGTGWFS